MAFEAQLREGNPCSIPHTAGADIAAGEVIVTGDRTGIAHLDIANGDDGRLYVDGGIYLVTKEAPLVMSIGDKVYWVAANNNINKTSAGNTFFGRVVKAALSADTSVLVEHQSLAD